MILEGNEQESIQQLDQPSPAKLSVILVNTMSSESIIMAITDIVSVINDLFTKISYYIYILNPWCYNSRLLSMFYITI